MKATLHFNLIKKEELLSPNPIRPRVMLPVLCILCALAVLVWWGLFALRILAAEQKLDSVNTGIDSVRAAHKEVLDLRAEERELSASLQQLAFYQNSRLLFGGTLGQIAGQVPSDIQFTELYLPPPMPPPMPAPARGQKPVAQTNTFENVTLRLAGRAGGDSPTDAINSLLNDLRKPAFTNLILQANVPPGAFRQEPSRGPTGRNTLLFEIICRCEPRRFE